MILLAFMIASAATRKPLVCLAGAGIMTTVGGIVYLVNRFALKSPGNELVLLLTVIFSGIFYAYYVYNKRAKNILIIYLFLLGSLMFINSVDYGFNHLLKPHQKERVNITLDLSPTCMERDIMLISRLFPSVPEAFPGRGIFREPRQN